MKKHKILSLIGICTLLITGCDLSIKLPTSSESGINDDSNSKEHTDDDEKSEHNVDDEDFSDDQDDIDVSSADDSSDGQEVDIYYEEEIDFWGDIYFLESSTDENACLIEDDLGFDIDSWTYFNCDKMVDKLPDNVTFDSFVGYVTYDGTSSFNTKYIIYKDDEWLMNYIFRFCCGEHENHEGFTFTKTAFIEEMNNLELGKKPDNSREGSSNTYGVLYFEKDGKVYGVYTNNIFDDYE